MQVDDIRVDCKLIPPRYPLLTYRLVRWAFLLARSLPMTFLLVGWPFVIVYVINHNASEALSSGIVLLQIALVLALQSLGTLRASQSWAARVNSALTASKAASDLQAPLALASEVGASSHVRHPQKPTVTYGFNWKAFGNYVAVFMLSYDFVQVGTVRAIPFDGK
jgi:hypothetical protein